MKTLLMLSITLGSLLCTSSLHGQDEAGRAQAPPAFLQRGEWWNLFFAEGNDPLLRAINAVKVLQVSDRHPSWVQVAFPKNRKEHLSIFRPAAKAHDDDSANLDLALADWEQSVTEWRVIWINLDFVVYMSKVGQSQAAPDSIDDTQPRSR